MVVGWIPAPRRSPTPRRSPCPRRPPYRTPPWIITPIEAEPRPEAYAPIEIGASVRIPRVQRPRVVVPRICGRVGGVDYVYVDILLRLCCCGVIIVDECGIAGFNHNIRVVISFDTPGIRKLGLRACSGSFYRFGGRRRRRTPVVGVHIHIERPYGIDCIIVGSRKIIVICLLCLFCTCFGGFALLLFLLGCF